MSSDGLRELKKRRVKAKKIISSSDENLSLNEDVSSNKTLPDFPQIGNFISKSYLDKSTYRSANLSHKRTSNSPSSLCKRTSYILSDDEKL